MSNRKLHMRFRLTPRSITLDDYELYKFKLSENFDTSGQGKQHNKTTTVPQPWCRQLCRKVGRHTTKHHKQDSTSNVYDSQSVKRGKNGDKARWFFQSLDPWNISDPVGGNSVEISEYPLVLKNYNSRAIMCSERISTICLAVLTQYRSVTDGRTTIRYDRRD